MSVKEAVNSYVSNHKRTLEYLRSMKSIRERPIIMGTDSVRAILEGRKTMTRRVVNKRALERFKFSPSGELLGSFNESHPEWEIYPTVDDAPYRVGDRLWVRETWSTLTYHEGDVPIHIVKDNKNIEHDVVYYAECPDFSWMDGDGFQEYRKDGTVASHWKSPLFMPRWASRITLEITDIRVERLQDITEDDAIAEGIISDDEYAYRAGEENLFPCPRCKGYGVHGAFGNDYSITEIDCTHCNTPKKRYRIIWDSLNAKRGYPWESNPWVWVISFKRIK